MCRTSDEAVELFAEGNGRARVRKSSEGEMALWASIGPALNASVNASDVGLGQFTCRPARAMVANAVKKEAIPPCFGWLVITGK